MIIERSAADRTPFLLEVASFAPHLPSTPAPRDAHRFLSVKAPRSPAFNESDISDKPRWLRSYRKLGPSQFAAIDAEYVMSNNFAFGGVNTSLIFRRAR